jgi:hypothetical protein
MPFSVVRIAVAHAGSFRAALDVVAREKKGLAMIEAPPLEQVQAFVKSNVEREIAQFVAVEDDRVGWADIVPAPTHGPITFPPLRFRRHSDSSSRALRSAACVSTASTSIRWSWAC